MPTDDTPVEPEAPPAPEEPTVQSIPVQMNSTVVAEAASQEEADQLNFLKAYST